MTINTYRRVWHSGKLCHLAQRPQEHNPECEF
jgi:hypothetical protein